MVRALKFFALLLLNVLVAVIGTAIVESAVWRLGGAPHSIHAVLWKDAALSTIVAALIGFGMWSTWRSESVKWTWVIPSLWFLFGAMAVSGPGTVFGSLFPTSAARPADARSYFLFTVTFIRGIAYSLGGYVSSCFYPRLVSTLAQHDE